MKPALFRRAGRWLIALFCVLGGAAFGYQQERTVPTDPQSGIEIKVGFPFNDEASSGFQPMHVVIDNRTGSAHSWDIQMRGSSNPASSHSTTVTVGAGQRRAVDLLIPWAGLDSSTPNYQSTACSITGPGVGGGGNFSLPNRYSGGTGTARVAFSESLGLPIWSALENDVKTASNIGSVEGARHRFEGGARTSGRALRGSTLKLEELPADARALSGFAGLWMTDAEWRSLAGPLRATLRQWVLEGGALFIAGQPENPVPGLLPAGEEARPLGFGKVQRVKLEGRAGATLALASVESEIWKLDGAPVPAWAQDFQREWPLRAAVGEPRLNVPLIIIFVVVFGILAGPVNLLWFAPAERRHRLFFTVPLLSVAASLLLLGLIAFGDGMGGDGARNVLLLAAAGENRLTLYQEQMVRTRLLLNRAFTLPETVAASYVGQEMQEGYRSRESSAISLTREGQTLGGDWFRTRATQGMYLRASIPSRGEVVVRAGPVPELLSTLSSTLRHVYYLDPAQNCWTVDELATGRPARMRSVPINEYQQWATHAADRFSTGMAGQWRSALQRPGYFYAEADATAENTIPTLHSVRWNEQKVLCLGPCTGETTP